MKKRELSNQFFPTEAQLDADFDMLLDERTGEEVPIIKESTIQIIDVSSQNYTRLLLRNAAQRAGYVENYAKEKGFTELPHIKERKNFLKQAVRSLWPSPHNRKLN